MAANILQNHSQSPFIDTRRPTRPVVLFSAINFELQMLLGISPLALRVMICLASRLNSKGYATASLGELAKKLGHSPSYINRGILELARCHLICKKKQGEYWLRPKAFRTAQLEV